MTNLRRGDAVFETFLLALCMYCFIYVNTESGCYVEGACKTQVLTVWEHTVFNLLNLTDSFVSGSILRAFLTLIHSVLRITLGGGYCYSPPIRDEKTEPQRSCVL